MNRQISLVTIVLLFLAACSTETSSDTGTSAPPKAKAKPPYEYSILKKVERKVVTNYYVWIKADDFTEEGLTKFVRFFRKEHCSGQCNISLYDTDKIKNDVDNFDLEGQKYLFLADHFIGSSSFDIPNEPIWWYPYQDAKYSKLGGKNWKKKPIK